MLGSGNLLARAYYAENRFVEALCAVDRAIAVDTEKTYHRCFRADILQALGRFEEAIQTAQAVLDAEPEHWHSFEQIIKAQVFLGRLRDAEARTKGLIQLAPAEPAALCTASKFYLSQGQLDQALKLLDKALDINTGYQQARHLRGLVLFKKADYRRANEDLRQFVAHDPSSVPAHCQLAFSLLRSGDWEEAINIADHLNDIDPGTFPRILRARIGID